MRVTAAARRRPVRCVADDSALSSVKVTVYNDIPRKGSPRGLPISSAGSPDSGSQHAHPDPTATSFPFRLRNLRVYLDIY
jgi:hypothetical protein